MTIYSRLAVGPLTFPPFYGPHINGTRLTALFPILISNTKVFLITELDQGTSDDEALSLLFLQGERVVLSSADAYTSVISSRVLRGRQSKFTKPNVGLYLLDA